MAPIASAEILIENVTIISGDGAAPISNAHVLIEGDRISRIADRPIDPPKDARRIDGAGKFLMPGLIDTHVHLRGAADPSEKGAKDDKRAAKQALASFLYSGVTSIYDAGNSPNLIFSLR
ncbi:MAG TPA: amidohydrolase family protein, partial [Parvularculaceae bacterium]|nr:amidohydrolase family protein [Parvularculaceae bacterium]